MKSSMCCKSHPLPQLQNNKSLDLFFIILNIGFWEWGYSCKSDQPLSRPSLPMGPGFFPEMSTG